MYDKIGTTELEIRNIINDRGLTQSEKFELAKEKSGTLSGTERKILLKKCLRDRNAHERSRDLYDLLFLFVTWISTYFVIFGIYANDKEVTISVFKGLLGAALLYNIITVMGLVFIQTWRNKNLNITQYMIDVLEDE